MQLVGLGLTFSGVVFQMEKMYASLEFHFLVYGFFCILVYVKDLHAFLLGFRHFLQLYDQLGNVICHGDSNVIKEGHKSFPCGHTSGEQQITYPPKCLCLN